MDFNLVGILEHEEDHDAHPGDWWEINICKLASLWLDDLNPDFTTLILYIYQWEANEDFWEKSSMI